MATIRVVNGKRGVTYEVAVRLAGHRPVYNTLPTRSAAKSWGRDLESKLAKGEFADSEAEHRTLHDGGEQYLKTHPGISSDHKAKVTWWMDNHGRRTLAKVTGPWLTQVRDELAAGTYSVGPADKRTQRKRQPSTVNGYLTYLLTVTAYCEEIGWIARSPRVKKLGTKHRVRFLSDDELPELTKALAACDERVMLPFVYCAISSGGRAGELLGLEWKDVNLTKGFALIHMSKNTDGRKLYFRGQALEYLKAYGKVRNLQSPGVFLLNSGAPLTHSRYGKLFREACKAAGIADFRFHDLRHCCASMLAQSGASLLEIQQVLGHRGPQMTARYAHLTESHVEDVVDRVMRAKLGARP